MYEGICDSGLSLVELILNNTLVIKEASVYMGIARIFQRGGSH